METPIASHETTTPTSSRVDALEARKRQIRTLKQLLIAKAEVRRLKALVGRRRIPKAN